MGHDYLYKLIQILKEIKRRVVNSSKRMKKIIRRKTEKEKKEKPEGVQSRNIISIIRHKGDREG